jgi:hypothetical protein
MPDEISNHVQRFQASIEQAEWVDQDLAKARIIGDVASQLIEGVSEMRAEGCAYNVGKRIEQTF